VGRDRCRVRGIRRSGRAVAFGGLTPDEKFLDVAAGPGGLGLAAARLGATVLATDWAPQMVAEFASRAARPAIRASRSLSRAGSLIGWLSALVIAMTGFVQQLQDVDNALLEGLVLGAAALIPAFCNDTAYRIAKRLVAS
jgi:hypothetical protein